MDNASSKTIRLYADVSVDFAFKRCFGPPQHKAATIGLLNALIPGVDVRDVKFINTELQGLAGDERKGIIDVLCTGNDDSVFIVEMQRAPQPFFRERTYFYSSLYVLNEARRGDWDYRLAPSYVVAFLNFPMREMRVVQATRRGETPAGNGVEGRGNRTDADGGDHGIPMLHYVTTESCSGEKMPGSTEFFFFDLAEFGKKEENLAELRDFWLFCIRNSATLAERPEKIKGPGFDEFFDAAEIAHFNKDERLNYEKAMVTEQDMKNALDFATQKGIEKGIEQEKARSEAKLKESLAGRNMEIARAMLKDKVDASVIAKYTGLSEKEILGIR